MLVTVLVLLFFFYSLVHCTSGVNGENQFRNGKHHPSIHLIPPGSNLLTYLHTYNDIECPYPYQNIGNVCLYAKNSCGSPLTFASAQLFCQTLGNVNGDLAVFRDANEFEEMSDYLKFIDPAYSCNYYLGASLANEEAGFNWVSDGIAPLSNYDIGWAPGYPDFNVQFPSYAIFAASKLFRLTNVADNGSNMSPICRAFPKGKIEVTIIH